MLQIRFALFGLCEDALVRSQMIQMTYKCMSSCLRRHTWCYVSALDPFHFHWVISVVRVSMLGAFVTVPGYICITVEATNVLTQ